MDSLIEIEKRKQRIEDLRKRMYASRSAFFKAKARQAIDHLEAEIKLAEERKILDSQK
jgi:hypothetical protein